MRTRKTVVVLISGKAGAGKTTLADLLEEKLKSLPDLRIDRYSLASPIKFVAQLAFGWDGVKDERGRKLLQDLGKVGRAYDINTWSSHLLTHIDRSDDTFPPNFVLVDDWRFPDEYVFFSDNLTLDVSTVRVFGRGGLEDSNGNDESETSLDDFWTESLIDNSGSIEDLETKIGEILESLKKNYIVE